MKVSEALRSVFQDSEIPEDFRYEGQTFEERCEAWAAHAIEQLEEELENPDFPDEDDDDSTDNDD